MVSGVDCLSSDDGKDKNNHLKTKPFGFSKTVDPGENIINNGFFLKTQQESKIVYDNSTLRKYAMRK